MGLHPGEGARGVALIAGAAVAAMLLGGVPAFAAQFGGVKVAQKIAVGKSELILNGAGVRHKLMTVPVYVGALYLAAPKRTAREVLADTGPKRVLMHVLIEELTAKELIASLSDAIAATISSARCCASGSARSRWTGGCATPCSEAEEA
jgi:hypothetical protein